MKNKNLYILVGLVVVAALGFLGYKYLFAKRSLVSNSSTVSVEPFIPNACWVYHEYVYRVDFRDQTIPAFFFVRDKDGTFSPSDEDKPGNQATGNGLIIDATGACIISDQVAIPWKLSEEEEKPLKDLVEEWLDLRPNTLERNYNITAQTVVLFVVLNDPENFIEYQVTTPAPGQENYSLIYPVEKTSLEGIHPVEFSEAVTSTEENVFRVLKTTFSEANTENPMVKVQIDSITAIQNIYGQLDNIKAGNGDGTFYEGSPVFDKQARLLGHLHYENNKWSLVSYNNVVRSPVVYDNQETMEYWKFDFKNLAWKKSMSSPSYHSQP